ncbi:MAG: YraN family protein [Oscillatoriales cyanobacterium RM2_1_1]|nr:YraN family protein [Oscillatoriales cyanobacterium SM2_3_0]NJO45710.1 YraN family protein [Oscillatoriales cyanobacterium RM2_1_1]
MGFYLESSQSASKSAKPKISSKQIGELGEQFVAHWLSLQGWQILFHQYHCRWGEIDLVTVSSWLHSGEMKAQAPTHNNILSFVEVKTRSRGNWDADGLLAITPTKQGKLIQSAQLFLSQFPQFAELPCRFDVALVRCEPWGNAELNVESLYNFPPGIEIKQPITIPGYQLTLQQYLESAFGS